LLGIFAEEWLEPVAHVLADLGTEKAWVVHGADGLDEMTTTGVTRVAILESGHVALREIAPEDAGLKRTTLAALKGGSAEENAGAIRDLLDGAKNAFRDIVLLNAGAALVVADKAKNIAEGAALAAEALDKGRAAQAFEKARAPERVKA
jgi:anthranilate phosphoribosyltransferase